MNRKKQKHTGPGHIKGMRTQEHLDLIVENLNAYALLTIIAFRANRDGRGGLYGCKIAEAVVNHTCCGLSQQEYRTAKKFLSERGYASFEVRGKGKHKRTYAKLLSTEIHDINLPGKIHSNLTKDNMDNNRQETNSQTNVTSYKQTVCKHKYEIAQQTNNRQATSKQRDSNDKQERRRKKQEEKKNYINIETHLDAIQSSKNDSGRLQVNSTCKMHYNIHIELEEHEKLLQEEEAAVIDKAYELLSQQKKSKGKEEGDILGDIASIRSWCIDAAKKKLLDERALQAKEKMVLQLEQKAENPDSYWNKKNKEKAAEQIAYIKKLKNRLTNNDAILELSEKGVHIGRHRPDPLYKPTFIPFFSSGFQEQVETCLRKEGVWE